MKLGFRNQAEQPFQILGKKIDSEGRSIYQVKWNNTQNIVEWIPLRNLTQYEKIIHQYDSLFPKPIKKWHFDTFQYQKEKQRKENEISFFSSEMEGKQKSEKPLQENIQLQSTENQSFILPKYKQYKDRKKWLRKEYRDISFITGLKPMQLQALKRKKKKVYERKGNLKIKKIQKRREQDVEEELSRDYDNDFKMVKTIYLDKKGWFVDMIKNNDEVVKMQKNIVRLNYPKLLLKYYEDSYQIQRSIQ